MSTVIKLIKKALLFIAYLFQFILWHFPVSVLALIGLYFTYKMFIDPTQDTTSISNYAFVIVAALSSLSFVYSQSVKDKEDKQKIQYCGERFLHSAILFLIASVLKYFIIQKQIKIELLNKSIDKALADQSHVAVILICSVFIFQGFLFLSSLINSIAALRELNTILYRRKKPFEELKRFF
ncbi:MAG: hypothetical protein ACLQBD_02450 [Syntrophobacteraceae bacterium]